jgi:processing peptidase subunit alpha
MSASAILRPRASLLKPSLAKRLASTIPAPPPPQITTLSNKLRVVTESTPGHFHAVGVYVDAGSRYETKRNSGISHLMDRLAFKVCLYTLENGDGQD